MGAGRQRWWSSDEARAARIAAEVDQMTREKDREAGRQQLNRWFATTYGDPLTYGESPLHCSTPGWNVRVTGIFDDEADAKALAVAINAPPDTNGEAATVMGINCCDYDLWKSDRPLTLPRGIAKELAEGLSPSNAPMTLHHDPRPMRIGKRDLDMAGPVLLGCPTSRCTNRYYGRPGDGKKCEACEKETTVKVGPKMSAEELIKLLNPNERVAKLLDLLMGPGAWSFDQMYARVTRLLELESKWVEFGEGGPPLKRRDDVIPPLNFSIDYEWKMERHPASDAIEFTRERDIGTDFVRLSVESLRAAACRFGMESLTRGLAMYRITPEPEDASKAHLDVDLLCDDA